jgi:hypothetical protein
VSGDQRPTRRSNGLGAAILATPVMLALWALLGWGVVEVIQWVTR